jgi:glycosyltransferase involved in cell wall biosynthesis
VLSDYPERVSATRIIHHDKNKGVAAARNTLLDNAHGSFVSFVDADDWLEKDAIELLVRKQEETDSDIVSGNAYIHIESGVEELRVDSLSNKRQVLLQQLKDTWTMNAFLWGRIYRRSLFEEHQIRSKEGFNYAEDRYQVVQLSYYAESYAFIDGFVYNYEKRNESSITKKQKSDLSVYLRNQYQHLQNWIGIRDFFSDKEQEYYQLAVSNSSHLLQLNLDWALKYKTRKDFDEIVRQIDANEDCMRVLGWQKSGIKGLLHHCFLFMRLRQLLRRSLRFVRRKFRLEE